MTKNNFDFLSQSGAISYPKCPYALIANASIAKSVNAHICIGIKNTINITTTPSAIDSNKWNEYEAKGVGLDDRWCK